MTFKGARKNNIYSITDSLRRWYHRLSKIFINFNKNSHRIEKRTTKNYSEALWTIWSTSNICGAGFENCFAPVTLLYFLVLSTFSTITCWRETDNLFLWLHIFPKIISWSYISDLNATKYIPFYKPWVNRRLMKHYCDSLLIEYHIMLSLSQMHFSELFCSAELTSYHNHDTYETELQSEVQFILLAISLSFFCIAHLSYISLCSLFLCPLETHFHYFLGQTS